MEVRIGDFLNDKVQTFADFDTLDFLIADVERQQTLLRKQLEGAQLRHQEAKNAYVSSSNKARMKASAFEKQQADIDGRLLIITQSDTADEAIRAFEPVLAHLKRLEVTDQYVQSLEEVEALQRSAVESLPLSPLEALATFHDLQALSLRLGPLQAAAEGAAPHLVDHVANSVANLRKQLRNTFADELEVVLGKILWPKKTVALPASLLDAFHGAAGKLLLLQKPEVERQANELLNGMSGSAPAVLLPLEVLVEPLAARFRYHFGGDRPTNRADKPEYFTSHFFDILNIHVDFVCDYIQPLLLEYFGDCAHKFGIAYLDATSTFITALLPMVREKALATFQQVSEHPQLLSHHLQELMIFDTTLREDWQYDGSVSSARTTPWRGITGDVLARTSNFKIWSSVESKFVIDRYQNIIADPVNGALSYDEVSSTATKPSTAAVRIYELMETTTQTYRPLTSLDHKLQFVIDVQCDLLDLYRVRLHDAIEAYLTATSALGRNLNLHGSSSNSLSSKAATDAKSLQGVAGLDRLCRILGSADFIERALRGWNDELFFVDLYKQIELRLQSKRPGNASTTAMGEKSVAQIASNTSAALASASDDNDDALGDVDPSAGAMFDEPAAKYADVRIRAETVLIDVMRNQMRESLKPYAQTSGFVDVGSVSDLTPTSSISGAAGFLFESFSFLARALSPSLLHRIVVATLRAADNFLFEKVVLGKDYGEAGAGQLHVDLESMVGAVERACARHTGLRRSNVGKIGLAKCLEAVRLLGLTVDGEGNEEEEDDSAWDKAQREYMDGDAEEGKSKQAGSLTHLWTVERRLFASNESARSVLADMELTALTEQDARRILKCRVELDN